MIYKNVKKYFYKPATPLKNAIRDLYQKKIDIGLVSGKNRSLEGIFTIGDVKKAIINGYDPETPIAAVLNREYIWASDKTPKHELIKLSLTPAKSGTGAITRIPILNQKKVLKGLFINHDADIVSSQKTALVTGGAGYVGSVLCRKLLEKGYKVICLDKLVFGHDSIKDLQNNPNFALIEGDINNIHDLVSGIKNADYVMHLAGIVGDPASAMNPMYTLECNHFATKSLIELSKYYQVSRFVFASSCSVYGANSKVLNENSKLNPISLYAKTKISAEKEILSMTDEYFHPIILRFGTIYGLSSRMRFDLVANRMTAGAYFNKQINVSGGGQWRPLLHVSDAADAYIAAIEAPLNKVKGQTFNVGSESENYTIAKIAETINALIPNSKVVTIDQAKDLRDYKVSFKKIGTLGYKTKYNLRKGIKEIVIAMDSGQFGNFEDPRHNNHLV